MRFGIAYFRVEKKVLFLLMFLDMHIFKQIHNLPVVNKTMYSEESFTVRALYEGGDVSFTIVPNEGHFGIMLYDKLIGEMQMNEYWEQTSGEALPPELIEEFGRIIEDHFE